MLEQDPAATPVEMPVEDLAVMFAWFGRQGFGGASPLYEHLCSAAAEDPELLELLVGVPRRKLPPLLLMAAVHDLLLRRSGAEALAAFYPSAGGAQPPDGAYPAFRELVLRRAPEVLDLMRRFSVQTNEVGRSAQLMLAFSRAQALLGRPPALLEVGSSAGLILAFDRYGYDFGEGRTLAPAGGSSLTLRCEPRGSLPPPVPATIPVPAARLGIDPAPVDLTDAEATAWLRACVWPEQPDRAARLTAAIAAAGSAPPRILTGDGVDLLRQGAAEVLAGASAKLGAGDAGLVIFHSHVVPYLGHEKRQELVAAIEALAAERDLCWISLEAAGFLADERDPEWLVEARRAGPSGDIVLRLAHFESGRSTLHHLARCQPHGAWIEWLAEP